MTGPGCGLAKLSLPQHSTKCREKSGLIRSLVKKVFRHWNFGSLLNLQPRQGEQAMLDMQGHLEKLLCDAEECTLISRLATDPQKKEVFTRLAEHLTALASEVERAIAVKLMGRGSVRPPQLAASFITYEQIRDHRQRRSAACT
jgi:hypothetical protein